MLLYLYILYTIYIYIYIYIYTHNSYYNSHITHTYITTYRYILPLERSSRNGRPAPPLGADVPIF